MYFRYLSHRFGKMRKQGVITLRGMFTCSNDIKMRVGKFPLRSRGLSLKQIHLLTSAVMMWCLCGGENGAGDFNGHPRGMVIYDSPLQLSPSICCKNILTVCSL